MGEAYEQHTGHMAPSHAAFLRHWLQLIDMEEAGMTSRRAEIWALSGALTAATVRCCAPGITRTVMCWECAGFDRQGPSVQQRADAARACSQALSAKRWAAASLGWLCKQRLTPPPASQAATCTHFRGRWAAA